MSSITGIRYIRTFSRSVLYYVRTDVRTTTIRSHSGVTVTGDATRADWAWRGPLEHELYISYTSTSGSATVRFAANVFNPALDGVQEWRITWSNNTFVSAAEVLTPTEPLTPTSITVKPRITSANISFSIDNGDSSLTDVEYRLGSGQWISTGQTRTTFTISGLTASTNYSVQIRGVNSIGNGAPSASVLFTTEALPTPASITGIRYIRSFSTSKLYYVRTDVRTTTTRSHPGVSVTGDATRRDWAPRGPLEHELYLRYTSTSGSATVRFAANVFNPALDGVQEWRITWSNNTFVSAAEVFTPTEPLTPTSITVTPRITSANIYFSIDNGRSSLTDVEYRFGIGQWISTGQTRTTFTISGLTASTNYSVQIRGVNSIGNGAASASVLFTTQALGSPAIFHENTASLYVIDRVIEGVSEGRTFKVFLYWEETVTGLNISNISASIASQSVSRRNYSVRVSNLSGSGRLYSLDVELTEDSAELDEHGGTVDIRISVSANAVDEDNPATSQNIRVGIKTTQPYVLHQTLYPDVDSDWEHIRTIAAGGNYGFQIYNNKLYLLTGRTVNGSIRQADAVLKVFNLDGSTASDISFPSHLYGPPSTSNRSNADGGFAILNDLLVTKSTFQSTSPLMELNLNVSDFKNVSSASTPLVVLARVATDGRSGQGMYSINNKILTKATGNKYYEFLYPDITSYFPSGERDGTRKDFQQDSEVEFDGDTFRFISNNVPRGQDIDVTPNIDIAANSKFIFGIIRGGFATNSNPVEIYASHRGYIFGYNHDYEILKDTYIPLPHRTDFLTGGTLRRAHNSPRITADDDYIYALIERASANDKDLYRLPMHKFTKPQQIQLTYPIFTTNGGSVDVSKYVEGAERIVWDTDYEPPAYATLSGTNIRISNNAVSEETIVEFRLKAFNKRGYTDDGIFKIVVVIQVPEAPAFFDFEGITLDANSTYDVSEMLSGEPADAWSSLQLPTGASLSGMTLRVGTTGGTARLRATKGSLSTEKAFTIEIDEKLTVDDFSPIFRWRLEIAGIDVTADLLRDTVSVSHNLDPTRVNQKIVDSCSVTLNGRSGHYTALIGDNFWSQNSLNLGGYLEPIKVYVESYVEDTWKSKLLFSGLILEPNEDIVADTITFNCYDDALKLREVKFSDVGVRKYAQSIASETKSYEGIYTLEASFLPIQPESLTAWDAAGNKLTLSRTKNPQIATVDGTAYVSPQDIRTRGGLLENEQTPLVRYKPPYFYKNVSFLLRELAKSAGFLNPVDRTVSKPALSAPEFQFKGNLAFNVAETRTMHIPRDWVHHNNKLYILLSNPHKNYKDMLVEHDLTTSTERVLKEFDESLTTCELATGDGVNFYISVTNSIDLDRSSTPVPRDTFETVRQYDRALGANTKIIRYNKNSDTTVDYVQTSHNRRPQVGLKYNVGAGNDLRLNTWEGIVPENRSGFEVYSGDVYFRYIAGSQFGVARATSQNTTENLLGISSGDYDSHINFAFDINRANGDVYMVYMTGGATNSTLTIQRINSAGTASQVYTRNWNLSQQTDLFADGGAVSGIHEVLYHEGDLYIIAEIQPIEIYWTGTGSTATRHRIRSSRKGAGAVLYKLDLSNTAAGLKIIEKHDFVQRGIRSLCSQGGEVYYIESPSVLYKFDVFNDDETDARRETPQPSGYLKKVGANDVVSRTGDIYFEDTSYEAISLPMLSISNELHFGICRSNPDAILTENSEGSRKDNFLWVKYGNTLEYNLPEISGASIYDALSDLAQKTYSLLSFQQNRIQLVDREPFRAVLATRISATATSLTYTGENKAFPVTGYLLIGSELIRYTARSGKSLSGLTRGFSDSEFDAHSGGAEIIYLDNILEADAFLGRVGLRLDTNRFYTVIRDTTETIEIRDAAQLARYLEKTLSLNLGLDKNNIAWIEYLAEKYLEDLKEIRYFVNLTVKPAFHINLGDIIPFYYDDELLKPMRVTTIEYQRKQTRIQGRTV